MITVTGTIYGPDDSPVVGEVVLHALSTPTFEGGNSHFTSMIRVETDSDGKMRKKLSAGYYDVESHVSGSRVARNSVKRFRILVPEEIDGNSDVDAEISTLVTEDEPGPGGTPPNNEPSDGDKGELTVSGSGLDWSINDGVVTTTKLGGDVTPAGKALLDDATAAAQRTTLGLGTAATAPTTQFAAAVHVHSAADITSGVLDPARLPAGTGDALRSGNLDQFADVTQAATKTLAITESTTLAGGTHSGVNTGDQSSVTGNAGTATTLQTPRTLGITGDLTWTSPAFNGGANVSAAGVLASVNSNVGSFGSTTLIPVVTVNAKGQVTAVAEVAAAGGGAAYDPYIHKSSVPVQILNSTTETSLFSAGAVTIPGGTLVAEGEILSVSIPFKFLNNSGANRTLQIKVKIAGVTVFDDATGTLPAAAAFRIGAVKVNLQRRSSLLAAGGIELVMSSTTATTTGLGDFAIQPTFGVGGFESANWTWANNTALDITAILSNATATIELDTYGASIRK